ncbi:hypothetical protein IWW34DRAFT_893440 [Fusarium oxysporum f. sp. albedinis]|nr:hypothetical protein IWW34DRAFT_893440 [Fusarium oxysporum f. sp. albedinis]
MPGAIQKHLPEHAMRRRHTLCSRTRTHTLNFKVALILDAVKGGHADTVDHLLQQGVQISGFQVHPIQEESRRETKRLQEVLKEQMEMTRELKEAVAKQEETVHDMGKQMMEIKDQVAEELQRVREQLETIAANATGGPQRSYSDVTRHHSYPTTLRGP